MTTWIFEPGHTEVGFTGLHMMVTKVTGHFKDIHGQMEFDWETCLETTFQGEIDSTKLWSGEPTRDEHLRSADFFDVANHPTISFAGRFTRRTGGVTFNAEATATIRGHTQTVPLQVLYLGEWQTPFWVGDENRGTMRRIGWEATTRVHRHDWGVSWQDELPGGGVVASDDIDLHMNVEAIDRGDLEKTGAIEYYS